MLLRYVGEKLPTHTGLVLTDVLNVEHDPKMTVLLMMEVGEDREDVWGVFDCEIFDRKVTYMVELVRSGHKFKKWEWGGGNAAEPLYVHTPEERGEKRKVRKLTHNEEEGPVMKHRRLSMYFSRKSDGGGDKYEALLGVVEGIQKDVRRLNRVVEKQGRLLQKYNVKGICKFSSSKLGGFRRKKRAEPAEQRRVYDGSDLEGSDDSMDGGGFWQRA
ncbi:unnamed protein product [Brassica oleracea var. botrytis]|uniref:Uncharacterized protein n=1 Tax=Brassica oleracea TaxID=3712 RepID=A0A3P6DPN7_BRAOL|nr:unnamed protein product [Brassica oleracea]